MNAHDLLEALVTVAAWGCLWLPFVFAGYAIFGRRHSVWVLYGFLFLEASSLALLALLIWDASHS